MDIQILDSAGEMIEDQIVDENNNHVTIEFTGGSGVGSISIESLFGLVDPITVTVEEDCVPAYPFYVRWINDLGGWEYQMTYEKKSLTKSRNVESEFVRKNGTRKQVGVTPEETISCGVRTDSPEWAEALANMIYSPKIQYYETYTAAWIDVTLDDSQRTVVDRPLPATDFEFTFVLPRRAVQF